MVKKVAKVKKKVAVKRQVKQVVPPAPSVPEAPVDVSPAPIESGPGQSENMAIKLDEPVEPVQPQQTPPPPSPPPAPAEPKIEAPTPIPVSPVQVTPANAFWQDAGKKPEDVEVAKGGKKKFWIILVLLFLLGAAIATGFFFFQQQKGSSETKKAEETPVVSPTPVASESAEQKVDLSIYTIKILNGSGTAGEAAKVQGLLEKAGFTVDSIGNATSSSVLETEVAVKEGVDKDYRDALKKELEKTYSVASFSALPKSEKVDVIVTIGSKLANE